MIKRKGALYDYGDGQGPNGAARSYAVYENRLVIFSRINPKQPVISPI
jgi:hypothetical protein